MRKHLRRLHFVREVPYPRGDGLALVLSLHAAEHRLEQVTRVYPPALALFQHAAILAGPSLIDVNALPEWLRAGTGPGPAGIPASPAPAYVPPRVERVRVPSRPRGDMGPREQSEVAANVFASMLGVASPTPFFPAQPPKGMNASPPPEQLQMGVAAGSQMRTGEPGPMARPSPVPGSYAAGNAGYQQPVAPPYPQANPPVAPNWQIAPNARPVKRGFLETIRSWFSR